MFAVRGT